MLLLKLCPASVETRGAIWPGTALLEDLSGPGFMAPEGLYASQTLIAQQGPGVCTNAGQ